MNNKHLISILISFVLTLGVAFFASWHPESVKGSVSVSNEYLSTTTDATWSGATATGNCKADVGGGFASSTVLGSIIVTSTSNADIYAYDGTTTLAHSLYPTTTIAAFPNVVAGTYTFDVTLKRGLCVIVTTTEGVASTTITYRPY